MVDDATRGAVFQFAFPAIDSDTHPRACIAYPPASHERRSTCTGGEYRPGPIKSGAGPTESRTSPPCSLRFHPMTRRGSTAIDPAGPGFPTALRVQGGPMRICEPIQPIEAVDQP